MKASISQENAQAITRSQSPFVLPFWHEREQASREARPTQAGTQNTNTPPQPRQDPNTGQSSGNHSWGSQASHDESEQASKQASQPASKQASKAEAMQARRWAREGRTNHATRQGKADKATQATRRQRSANPNKQSGSTKTPRRWSQGQASERSEGLTGKKKGEREACEEKKSEPNSTR